MNQKLVDAINLLTKTEKKLSAMGITVESHCCTGETEVTLELNGVVEEVTIAWNEDTQQFEPMK